MNKNTSKLLIKIGIIGLTIGYLLSPNNEIKTHKQTKIKNLESAFTARDIKEKLPNIDLKETGINEIVKDKYLKFEISSNENYTTVTLIGKTYTWSMSDNQNNDGIVEDAYLRLSKRIKEESCNPFIRQHHNTDYIKDNDEVDLFLLKFHKHQTNKETYYKDLPPEAQPGAPNFHRWQPQDTEFYTVAQKIFTQVLFPKKIHKNIKIVKR